MTSEVTATLAMPHVKRYATLTSTAASWRRGYAADCKDESIPFKINAFPKNGWQDNSGTHGELDNIRFTGPAHLKPAADAATALCLAIGDCHPQDALEIMSAALDDLRAGMPGAPFLGLMDEAKAWAALACRDELKAYILACFAALGPHDRAAFLGFVQRGASA